MVAVYFIIIVSIRSSALGVVANSVKGCNTPKYKR